MSVLHSALLGIIQGLGEFLPISSSGHLLLARIFFGIQTDTPAMKMLDILLHVGTLRGLRRLTDDRVIELLARGHALPVGG